MAEGVVAFRHWGKNMRRLLWPLSIVVVGFLVLGFINQMVGHLHVAAIDLAFIAMEFGLPVAPALYMGMAIVAVFALMALCVLLIVVHWSLGQLIPHRRPSTWAH